MQVSSLQAAVLAAFLAVLPSLSLAEVCKPGASLASGVCEEVRLETGASLELLQHRADRAQPEKGASEKQGASEHRVDRAQPEKGASEKLAAKEVSLTAVSKITKSKERAERINPFSKIGDKIGNAAGKVSDAAGKISDGIDSGIDSVKNAFDTTALAGITSVINSTIVMLEEKADALQVYCQEYHDDLMKGIQVAVNKLETLQSLVNSNLDPLIDRWSAISEALSAAAPPIASAMRTFGLKSTVEDGVKQISEQITTRMGRLEWFVTHLANSTNVTDQDRTLIAIRESVKAGITEAKSFEASVNNFLQGTITQVGQKLGVDVAAERPSDKTNGEIYDTLELLMQGSAELTSTLEQDLEILFNGTYDASEEAYHATPQQSAAAGFWKHGVIAMAAACLGAPWL